MHLAHCLIFGFQLYEPLVSQVQSGGYSVGDLTVRKV